MFKQPSGVPDGPRAADHLPPPSFRLQGGEYLAAGLQRVSLEQLDHALAALTGLEADIGIHEARKAMRRVRAVLRLVRDVIGPRVYRAENVWLRDSGRKIGSSRDATVMVQTLDGIAMFYGDALRTSLFGELREHLLDRDQLMRHRAKRNSIVEVIGELQSARSRFAAWPVAGRADTQHLIADQFASVDRGIRRVYRRGRNRMADAYQLRTSEVFHSWRKRVRYLRFQMEVLEGMWPRLQRELAGDIAELAETLGAEHDLATLNLLLQDEPVMLQDRESRELLQALLERNQLRLQMAARPLGDRVYAETPQLFVARLGAYWEAWRPQGQ